MASLIGHGWVCMHIKLVTCKQKGPLMVTKC